MNPAYRKVFHIQPQRYLSSHSYDRADRKMGEHDVDSEMEADIMRYLKAAGTAKKTGYSFTTGPA